jgi:hypothetical protein
MARSVFFASFMRGIERVEDDVLVVSLDRLAYVLRLAAGWVEACAQPTRAALPARRPRTLRCELSADGKPVGACAPGTREREREVRPR